MSAIQEGVYPVYPVFPVCPVYLLLLAPRVRKEMRPDTIFA